MFDMYSIFPCRVLPVVVLALLTWPAFFGCASTSTPVRHLSSDVCLVMPESTTRQEVLSFLGEPDRKLINPENVEVWLYLKVNKSFAKKTPLLGDKLGYQNYETVTVSFDADLVRACLYRQLEENEFEKFIFELEQPGP